MQQTVEGILMIMLHLVIYLIAHMQGLKEATAVLNEWERTCLPPQNEEVSKFFIHAIKYTVYIF